MAPIVNVPAGISTNSIPTLLVRRGASLVPCSCAGMARQYRVMAAISSAPAAAKVMLDVTTRWGGYELCTLRVSEGGLHASPCALCILLLLLSVVECHGYFIKTCEDEPLVEVGSYSVCSCCPGAELITWALRMGSMALGHGQGMGSDLSLKKSWQYYGFHSAGLPRSRCARDTASRVACRAPSAGTDGGVAGTASDCARPGGSAATY